MNQRLPSGPAAMPIGPLPAVMPLLNSVTAPAGVMRPMRLPLCSVNQRLPSGPAAMPVGPLLAEMPLLNSVTVPAGVMRPMRLPVGLGEPEVAVRPRRDAVRLAAGGDAAAELGDRAGRGDAADPVAVGLGEPEVAVRPRGNAERPAVGGDAAAELGEGGGRRARRVGELVGGGPARSAAPFTVTVTSTVPAACGKVRAVQLVVLLQTTAVAAVPPICTGVAPGVVLKPCR